MLIAVSVLSQGIVALSDPAVVQRYDTGLFQIELSGGVARVRAQKHLPETSLIAACRHALMMPLQQQNHTLLESRTKLELPSELTFAAAEILAFSHTGKGEWRYCHGEVVSKGVDVNLAGLAVVQAWQAFELSREELLRPLVQQAISFQQTVNDAVMLVAVASGGIKGVAYLKAELQGNDFMLEQSRQVGGKFLLQHNEFDLALKILSPCKQGVCAQLYRQAEMLQQQYLAEDLQNYF